MEKLKKKKSQKKMFPNLVGGRKMVLQSMRERGGSSPVPNGAYRLAQKGIRKVPGYVNASYFMEKVRESLTAIQVVTK